MLHTPPPSAARRTPTPVPLAGAGTKSPDGKTPFGATPTPSAEPDAELLRLGRLFDGAWRAENACWAAFPEDQVAEADDDHLWAAANAAADLTSAIADQIEAIAATTLAGVLMKVRVVSWAQGGEPSCDSFWSGSEHPTQDERLVAAILRDLAAIGGSPLPPHDAVCSAVAA